MYPNLPPGESQSARQNNVEGSLRCSWDGRRRGNEWEAEREQEKGRVRVRVCVWLCLCVYGKRERARLSVQARAIVWRGRVGSVSQSQHLSFSLHQGWGTIRPFASIAADLTHFHQRSHLFFLAFHLLLLTDAFHSSQSVSQDLRISWLKTRVVHFNRIMGTFAEDSAWNWDSD